MDLGVLTEEDVDRLEAEVKAEIQAAFDEVEALPVSIPSYRAGSLKELEETAIAEL